MNESTGLLAPADVGLAAADDAAVDASAGASGAADPADDEVDFGHEYIAFSFATSLLEKPVRWPIVVPDF